MDDAIVKTERLQKKRIWLATIPALVMCALIWLIFLIDFSQVLRFNFSHADYENTARVAKLVKKLNEEKKTKL